MVCISEQEGDRVLETLEEKHFTVGETNSDKKPVRGVSGGKESFLTHKD